MERIPSSIAQRLQQLILSGGYAQGRALPAQRELARELGISRASLREALSVLEALGLVRIHPGKGAIVQGPHATHQPQEQHFATSNWGALTPRQLFELRLVLEPGWAALATAHITQATQRQLQRLQLDFQQALQAQDVLRAVQADLDFHLLLAQLSGNPGLQAMAQQLQHAIAHSLRMPFVWSGASDHPAQEHQAIVDALCAHDAEGAAHAMQLHLIHAARRCGVDMQAMPHKGEACQLPSFHLTLSEGNLV